MDNRKSETNSVFAAIWSVLSSQPSYLRISSGVKPKRSTARTAHRFQIGPNSHPRKVQRYLGRL